MVDSSILKIIKAITHRSICLDTCYCLLSRVLIETKITYGRFEKQGFQDGSEAVLHIRFEETQLLYNVTVRHILDIQPPGVAKAEFQITQLARGGQHFYQAFHI